MHILEVGRQRKRYVLKKERKKRRWNEVENRISVGDGGIAVYAWANRNLMDYTESGHSPFLQTLGRRAWVWVEEKWRIKEKQKCVGGSNNVERVDYLSRHKESGEVRVGFNDFNCTKQKEKKIC